MATVRELHNQAMVLSHQAIIARDVGNIQLAYELSKDACKIEAQAADMISEEAGNEPTRSILYRSAASLAFQYQDFGLAQRLIAKGMSGYPPPEVLAELKGLYQQVTFEDHLRIDEKQLSDADFQFSLAGNYVGLGIIPFEEFFRRLKSLSSLVKRTTERMLRLSFQSEGRPQNIARPYSLALSTAMERSYAITVKLTSPPVTQLPLFVNPKEIIDELLTNFKLLNENKDEELRLHIGNADYYRNFITMTKDLSPDGNKISMVGFSSNTMKVALQRKRETISIQSDLSLPQVLEIREDKEIVVIGELKLADSRKTDMMGIITEDGKEYDFRVEKGMEDLVRNYYNQWVKVTGRIEGDLIYPIDIEPQEE